MSEPARWGPPGFDVASGPTVPLPTVPRPAPPSPAPPRPTAAYPTRQEAPFAPAAGRDDYRDDYRDDHRDDYRDDRDPYWDDDPPERPRSSPARPRRRGQIFAGLVLVLALAVSAALGVLTYETLASVHLTSADPLGNLAGRAATLGAVALGALVVFLLAVIALAVARPKALAAIGLAASLLLPVGAVALGVKYGGAVLRQNIESDVTSVKNGLAADGASAARTLLDELKRNGVDPGPLGDVIVQIAGQGG